MPGVVLERKPVYPVSAGTAPEYIKLAVVDGGGWGGIFIKAHLLARDVVNESGHPLPAASGAHGVKRTISATPVINEIKFISVDGGTWRGSATAMPETKPWRAKMAPHLPSLELLFAQ